MVGVEVGFSGDLLVGARLEMVWYAPEIRRTVDICSEPANYLHPDRLFAACCACDPEKCDGNGGFFCRSLRTLVGVVQDRIDAEVCRLETGDSEECFFAKRSDECPGLVVSPDRLTVIETD